MTVVETSKLHSQLNDKGLQIRRLQMELERNEDEEVDGTEGLKSVIASLEEEKRKLQHGDSFEGSAAKEELEKSLRLFEKDLKEAHQQRDKALQELARLKQHLLDKIEGLEVMLILISKQDMHIFCHNKILYLILAALSPGI